MHPAPSLSEAPPIKGDELRQSQQRPMSSGSVGRPDRHSPSASPPVRKDTNSSTSTTATSTSAITMASLDGVTTSYSADSSPTFPSQAIFSVKDGSDISNSRRTSRRRTGPLSAQQREKAALIRKLGACPDCRRRRVACHPSHHNMTWEDALTKYKSHGSSMPELAPFAVHPLSPAPGTIKGMFTHDPQDMDVDSTPTHGQPLRRASLSDSRIRTPLPSGPRLEKLASAVLPGIETLKTDLQSVASRIVSNPHRNRYDAAHALLLYWNDDVDIDTGNAMEELASVLEKQYHYTSELIPIPSASDLGKSPWRWLSNKVSQLVDERDHRNIMNIVYYNGHSFLDADREMVLASSRSKDSASTIRWSGIQQILEDACSDTLLIMDAAYYPSSKMVRHQGVLEMVAASASEDHARVLDRNTFTRMVSELLRTRASQNFMNPFTAAELHAKLLSLYPRVIQDRHPERETITSFPSPLHMQISGSTQLPSILLAPIRKSLPFGMDPDAPGPQVSLTIRLNEEALNMDSWAEWFRAMPQGVKDIKVEGPYRNTFR